MKDAISLFSGAGASGLGLQRAGVTLNACFEMDADACETLRLRGRYVLEGSVRDVDFTPFRGVDLVEGGPPCQPFSQAGLGAGSSDPRDCIPDFVRAVAEARPRMFIMENVRALTFQKHRAYLEAVLASFPPEYHVDWRVLSSEEYGVPQTRKRLFIVGRLDGLPRWPEPTHRRYRKGVPQSEGDPALLPWVSMAEALGWGATERPSVTLTAGSSRTGAPAPLDGGSGSRAAIRAAIDSGDWVVTTGDKPAHWDGNDGGYYERSVRGTAPTVACGAGHKWILQNRRGNAAVRSLSEPAPTVTVSSLKGDNVRWSEAGWSFERPSTTIVGSFCPDIVAGPGYRRAGDGPRQNAPGSIKVTPEEAACLQGFPPDWKFVGSKTSVFRQIGNACPPAFTEAIARANAAT